MNTERLVIGLIGLIALVVVSLNIAASRNPDLIARQVCVGGFEYVHSGDGQLRQVFDANGHGIKCSK